jgi:hypothetical protein
MKIFEHKAVRKSKTFFDNELKLMAEDKNISKESKKHWCHKPYVCDFGGGEV